ncbi:ExbD/TolR family protein [Leptospira sp. WS92.C1]
MKSSVPKRKSLLEGEDSPLDLTSMLDVVFILLIFAMVAMSFQKEIHSLPVNLPKTNSTNNGGIGSKKEIFLLKNGELQYSGQKFSEEEWKQIVSKGEFKDTIVWLYGDEEIGYGKLIRVLESLKNGGLKELHLAVRKE